jgi:hypothetical protein
MGLFGYSSRRVEELKKEKLFSISIGEDVEEIGVIRDRNGFFSGPSSVLFKNGFFYVVDGVNRKILKITTPGDVILVISHGDEPELSDQDVLRTKQRRQFHFDDIGQIAVDNENNIFVENRFVEKLPEKEEIDLFNAESTISGGNNEVYMSRILKFDRIGTYQYSIGVNGRDTDPFYLVYKINVDENGNLLVITTDDEWETWTYYKYDTDGNLIFTANIHTEEVYSLEDMEQSAFFVMDVYPVYDKNQLVFWISLYNTEYDTKTLKKEEDLWGEEIEIDDPEKLKEEESGLNGHTGNDLLYYKLLYVDLGMNDIIRSFEWEKDTTALVEPTEEFFGIDGDTNGFIWKYVDNAKAIISIYRPTGVLLSRRSFIFEEDGIWTNVRVAVDGSVSAIKIDEKRLQFYRWRSDKLTTAKSEKVTVEEFFKDKIQEFKNANR